MRNHRAFFWACFGDADRMRGASEYFVSPMVKADSGDGARAIMMEKWRVDAMRSNERTA
jgi:hypothetical protein